MKYTQYHQRRQINSRRFSGYNKKELVASVTSSFFPKKQYSNLEP